MPRLFFVLIAAVGLFASAKRVPLKTRVKHQTAAYSYSQPTAIWVAEFNGSAINMRDKNGREDRHIKPTWIVPRKSGYLVSDANQGGLLELRCGEGSKTIAAGGYSRGSIGISQMPHPGMIRPPPDWWMQLAGEPTSGTRLYQMAR
jgi:hypothetical protein